jgi:hypothetical protein
MSCALLAIGAFAIGLLSCALLFIVFLPDPPNTSQVAGGQAGTSLADAHWGDGIPWHQHTRPDHHDLDTDDMGHIRIVGEHPPTPLWDIPPGQSDIT